MPSKLRGLQRSTSTPRCTPGPVPAAASSHGPEWDIDSFHAPSSWGALPLGNVGTWSAHAPATRRAASIPARLQRARLPGAASIRATPKAPMSMTLRDRAHRRDGPPRSVLTLVAWWGAWPNGDPTITATSGGEK